MPPLIDLPKEEIIDRLMRTIHEQQDELARLRTRCDHVERKVAHGCTDAHCEACDGPR